MQKRRYITACSPNPARVQKERILQRLSHTHDSHDRQATASLEAVALAIKEVVLRQMIESANTVGAAALCSLPPLHN